MWLKPQFWGVIWKHTQLTQPTLSTQLTRLPWNHLNGDHMIFRWAKATVWAAANVDVDVDVDVDVNVHV